AVAKRTRSLKKLSRKRDGEASALRQCRPFQGQSPTAQRLELSAAAALSGALFHQHVLASTSLFHRLSIVGASHVVAATPHDPEQAANTLLQARLLLW